MSNLIFILLFILISYLIFLFEKGNYLYGLSQVFSFNILNESIIVNENMMEKKNKVNNDYKIYGSGQVDKYPETHKASNIVYKSDILGKKIEFKRRELNSNLKHLEYILTIENQLSNLAYKNTYTVERLEEYIKIKKEIQLKIIELSQIISHHNSSKSTYTC